jgi:hypothetical protein
MGTEEQKDEAAFINGSNQFYNNEVQGLGGKML